MEIYSVFIIVAGNEAWDWEVEGEKPRFFDLDDDTQDFLLGTFSSEEAAEADLAKFLPEYKVDIPDTSDRFGGWNQPIRGVTLWKTELDAGQTKGEFIKWMRGDAEHALTYPYE